MELFCIEGYRADIRSRHSGGQDSTVKLFDALSGECLHTLSGFDSGTGSIAFSPLVQNLIAVGGWNGLAGIYDLAVSESAFLQRSRSFPARAFLPRLMSSSDSVNHPRYLSSGCAASC